MNESLLFDMLDNEDCAAFVMSSDQTILHWNRGAEQLLGYRASDVVGRRCYDISDPTGGRGLSAECLGGCPAIRYLRAGLVPSQCQLRISCFSGERKWFSVAPMVATGFGKYSLLVYMLEESAEREPVSVEDAHPQPAEQVAQQATRGGGAVSPPRGGGSNLTHRELEVLTLVAQGWETRRIASELGVSQHTVRNHIRNLRHKLNASNKLEAVVTGIREGMLPVDPR